MTTVQRTGVETIDDDSARVLVAGLISRDPEDHRAAPPVPYQLLVELEKVQGKWLVADFNDVGGVFE